MPQISYLKKRDGGVYYAQIAVPVDLQSIIGAKMKERSLRTKDHREAKLRMIPVIAEWKRMFEELSARRVLTDADKAHATWQHYTGALERYEQIRQTMPTEVDVEAAMEAAIERVQREKIDVRDRLAVLDASLDLMALKDRRKFDENSRRVKLAEMRKHLATGEAALIEDELEDYIQRNKLIIDPLSPERGDLARRMMRAEIEALERTLERDTGDYSGTPKDPIVKPATGKARETAAPGESIMEVFAIYERENPNNVKPDTLAQARRDIGTFVDYVGSTYPVHRIDKKAVREWKALLMKYPVKATETKAFEGLKIAHIVKHNERIGKPTISTNTVNRYLSGLGAFCGWLVAHGYLDSNPVTDMFLAKKKDKVVFPFKVDQMNALFKSPFFTGCQGDESPRLWSKSGNVHIRDHRYWVPLVMLYSGARPGEIAQLAVSDVRQEHGYWVMHITDEGDGDDDKSVKNEKSMRLVPVHKELVKLGFLDYHADMKEAGEDRLFPLAERNSRGQMIADFSRDFGRYLTKIGLKNGRGLSLYSFRHGVFDAYRRAGYLDEQFNFMLGHASGNKVTGGYGVLPQGMLKQRVELVNAVAYPGLELAHLHAAYK
ncbi:tyrosine-type recombinase/integrase [Sinorhizobium meliloti]|nr:tyrosine-type recombinase/integrase [Sinorhizobium meliloti]